MKKTGLEIVEMMARGEAPKKIYRIGDETEWELDDGKKYIHQENEDCIYDLDIIEYLNEEFEIIEDEPKVWKPKYDEEYYYMSDDGNIIATRWKNTIIDRLRYEVGNCFKTLEEAQKALEKIKIYVRLKRYAEEHNEEKIDFKNDYQMKYYLCYNHYHDRMEIENFNKRTAIGKYYQFIGNIYFTSEKLCKQAVKDIGEENIKKLFEE